MAAGTSGPPSTAAPLQKPDLPQGKSGFFVPRAALFADKKDRTFHWEDPVLLVGAGGFEPPKH